jgi:hypothetical protein
MRLPAARSPLRLYFLTLCSPNATAVGVKVAAAAKAALALVVAARAAAMFALADKLEARPALA